MHDMVNISEITVFDFLQQSIESNQTIVSNSKVPKKFYVKETNKYINPFIVRLLIRKCWVDEITEGEGIVYSPSSKFMNMKK